MPLGRRAPHSKRLHQQLDTSKKSSPLIPAKTIHPILMTPPSPECFARRSRAGGAGACSGDRNVRSSIQGMVSEAGNRFKNVSPAASRLRFGRAMQVRARMPGCSETGSPFVGAGSPETSQRPRGSEATLTLNLERFRFRVRSPCSLKTAGGEASCGCEPVRIAE